VETGVQEICKALKTLDSGFRRNDGKKTQIDFSHLPPFKGGKNGSFRESGLKSSLPFEKGGREGFLNRNFKKLKCYNGSNPSEPGQGPGAQKRDAGFLTGKKEHPVKNAQMVSFVVREWVESGSRKY
jgi:hypothetical protein